MSRPVVLSVNGRHGSDIPDNRQQEQNRELIRRAAASIHGAHGADATPAKRGEPAGMLYVGLTESLNHPEGFVVKTVVQEPENRNPEITEVLPQKNVVFEAVGGDGETGRRGCDGQSGMDGTPGQDATRVQDATAGTIGGDGGSAGAGTNGGDAGNGGQIRIYVDEDKTHLLLATSWEVNGGKGGAAGEHGNPGLGGKGGKGGESITWQEQNGYQYKCTENCAGRTTAPASNVKAIAKHDPRLLLVQGIGQQVSAGSSMQTAITKFAHYRANTVRDTTGLCECSGGNGHCTGCDALPAFQTRSRVKGDDGMDGKRGDRPTEPLFRGKDGRPGEGLIIVKPKTIGGVEKQYRSKYQLELVDFDLEDENGDGIFEPGECILVRRIRVKNSGGMPSPTRKTRIEINPSEHFQSLVGNDGVAYIPSIPAGYTVTLPDSIKILIREPDMVIGSEAYKMTETISLRATMPGLNRRLDHFDFVKSFEIQFPLQLQQVDYLQSVIQGSENKISMQILNQSNRPFEASEVSPRRAQVKMSIPSEAGSLLSGVGVWSPEVYQETGTIEAGSTVDISQTSKISQRAKDHAYTTILVELFISSPGPPPESGKSLGDLGIPMRLTQSFHLKMQISAAHIYDEDAGILVVTNVETPLERFEAVRQFIQKDLCLKMDVWNVSQYGGLIQQEQNKEGNEAARNILEEYRGRTIIFLGNKFEHFGVQEQTMINLCESDIVGKECFAGSSCLLLGSAAKKKKRDAWLKDSVFPVTHKISDLQLPESATFESKAALARSISEQRMAGMSTSQAYQIESQPKWYYGGAKMNVNRLAKQTQKHLSSTLPQERFWVCPVYAKIERGRIQPGYVAIWHGLPSHRNILATESKSLLEERGKPKKLHPFDSFNIICSLSYSVRLHLLCSLNNQSVAMIEEKQTSIISQESNTYSGEILDAVQFSLEENVSHEIKNYLSASPTFNNISLGASQDPESQFAVHFPCLETILQEFSALEEAPARVIEILQMAIAATYPQTIGQAARSIALPIKQRRAQLKSYLTRRIEAILVAKGYTPGLLKEFNIKTKAKHSIFSSRKRDTAKVIEERNRKFAKVPMNKYRKGRLTTEDLVEGTKVCTQQEWDARCRELKQTRGQLKRSVTRAMTKREKMSTVRRERLERVAEAASNEPEAN